MEKENHTDEPFDFIERMERTEGFSSELVRDWIYGEEANGQEAETSDSGKQ